MGRTKRVIVDLHDTLGDLVQPWLVLYNEKYNDDLTPDEITDWDMLKFVVPECGERLYEFLNDAEIYQRMPVIDGALEGIRELRRMGFHVLFVTANDHPANPAWLIQHGFMLPDEMDDFIVCRNKGVIDADYIIDDKPDNVATFPGRGILFDRPHNRKFNWKSRALNWDDVIRKISMMELEASKIVVPGLGKDAPMCVNDAGGKQSKINYRFDLLDPLPLFRLAHVVAYGSEKYGAWNWRRISLEDNLNHAITHILAHLAGDRQDDHLGHAFCRLHFALSLDMTPGDSQRMVPPDD